MEIQGSHINTLLFSEEHIQGWITLLNERAFKEGAKHLADEVELFGNFVLDIFPDSQGLIQGKRSVLFFLQIFFRRFKDRYYVIEHINFIQDKAIIRLYDEQGRVNYLSIRFLLSIHFIICSSIIFKGTAPSFKMTS